jgi:hypothetical protein
MMGIRRNAPHSAPHVLRGDRQLATRLWWGELKGNTAIKSPQEIINKLNKYKAGYVVVEIDMPTAKEFQEYYILLHTLKNNHLFKEVATFRIETNYRDLGSGLVVYKFDYDEKIDNGKILTIPVPTLEKDLKVAF